MRLVIQWRWVRGLWDCRAELLPSLSPVQIEVKTGRVISHWPGHSENPWLLNRCVWKRTKANTANILPTLWTLSYHRAATHRLSQPRAEESHFLTHLFLTVLPIFGIIWILLKIKLYLACTDDFKVTTAPFPETLKSVEAPKVQWSMHCPTASGTGKAQGCSQVFGHVEVGWKNLIIRCQELRFYLCMAWLCHCFGSHIGIDNILFLIFIYLLYGIILPLQK